MDERYLRRSEVERLVGLSKATIYRRVRAKNFPAPYHIGGCAVRWRRSELVAWSEGLGHAGSAANDR
jgi:prophage regulatory protein